jgi:hypothetical protein
MRIFIPRKNEEERNPFDDWMAGRNTGGVWIKKHISTPNDIIALMFYFCKGFMNFLRFLMNPHPAPAKTCSVITKTL